VGVNRYATEDYPPIPTLKVGPEVEDEQVERLNKVRAERDKEKWSRSMEWLERSSKDEYNVMPYVIDAVKAYASVGEICDVWRKVFGEYRAPAEF
jgi:methylmalonyl-CoA mutase N-terminal domain/subunit